MMDQQIVNLLSYLLECLLECLLNIHLIFRWLLIMVQALLCRPSHLIKIFTVWVLHLYRRSPLIKITLTCRLPEPLITIFLLKHRKRHWLTFALTSINTETRILWILKTLTSRSSNRCSMFSTTRTVFSYRSPIRTLTWSTRICSPICLYTMKTPPMITKPQRIMPFQNSPRFRESFLVLTWTVRWIASLRRRNNKLSECHDTSNSQVESLLHKTKNMGSYKLRRNLFTFIWNERRPP